MEAVTYMRQRTSEQQIKEKEDCSLGRLYDS
jgi:hypothetical protein